MEWVIMCECCCLHPSWHEAAGRQKSLDGENHERIWSDQSAVMTSLPVYGKETWLCGCFKSSKMKDTFPHLDKVSVVFIINQDSGAVCSSETPPWGAQRDRIPCEKFYIVSLIPPLSNHDDLDKVQLRYAGVSMRWKHSSPSAVSVFRLDPSEKPPGDWFLFRSPGASGIKTNVTFILDLHIRSKPENIVRPKNLENFVTSDLQASFCLIIFRPMGNRPIGDLLAELLAC